MATEMRCPYCSASQGRCATSTSGRYITECVSCGRVVEERQTQPHHLFHIRAQDSPLCLSTSDLPTPIVSHSDDPFEPTGFITAFSTWSLEPYPIFAHTSLSFAGHLAELERVLETTSPSNSNSNSVVVDNLRAYLQIIDVASILGLDYDISDHAFQLFRDCSSATCLRNRSVEALATAALVQAIREAQEPRTLQVLWILACCFRVIVIGYFVWNLWELLIFSMEIGMDYANLRCCESFGWTFLYRVVEYSKEFVEMQSRIALFGVCQCQY